MSSNDRTTCIVCGSPVPPSRGSRPRKHCSPSCKYKYYRANRSEIQKERARQAARRRREQRQAQRQQWWGYCVLCSRLYRLATPRSRCPEPDCQQRRATFTVTGVQGRKRAERMGSPVEEFDPIVIYNKHQGRCAICGVKVRTAGGKRQDTTASIDHVVPISAGGPHTEDNCQLLCFGCNMRKGTA